MTEDEKILKERIKRGARELAGRVSQNRNEIGPEIPLDRLHEKLRQVVVVQVEGFPFFLTFWLEEVTASTATFHSAELNWSVKNFRQPDGTLRDDKDRRIRVFEYLGAV